LRAAKRLPSLRKQTVFLQMRHAFGKASRASFRVVHFSVQADHVHLLVEAADKRSLSRGTSGLSIRLARAVNRVLGRRGSVWGDRYHARALRTPREVRHGLVYVLMNWKKHVIGAEGIDPCASVFWFDGWKNPLRVKKPPAWDEESAVPVVPSETWLGARGWRRLGLISEGERPKSG
jgi:REP element-mobilizing transposase RayT